MSRDKTQRTGLTLIEIIFSIAILGTVITLAYASALAAWRSAQAANQRTQAQYLLQKAVEQVKGYRDSSSFVWSNFLGNANIKDGFYVDLDTTTGAFTVDYIVSDAGPPSTAKVLQAAGQKIGQSDPTQYYLVIKPVDEWRYDSATNTTTQGSFSELQPDNIAAYSVVATVTYKDAATGVMDNAQVTTIISRRSE